MTGPWTSATGPNAHHWTVWSGRTVRGPAPPDTSWSCFCRIDPPPHYYWAHSQHTHKRSRWAEPHRATWLEPHKHQWRCSSTPSGSRSSFHGDKVSWDWGNSQCRASRAWCWRRDLNTAELQLGPVRKLSHRRSSGCGCTGTEKRPLRRLVPLLSSEVPWNCSQLWLSGSWRSAKLSGSYPWAQPGCFGHAWQRFNQNKEAVRQWRRVCLALVISCVLVCAPPFVFMSFFTLLLST